MVKYPITPVPKPRMTKRDSASSMQNRIQGMRPAVARYFAFKQEVQLRKVYLPPCNFHMVFILPMPASWSEKKKATMAGMPHIQVPDTDNLIKALKDAVHQNDAHLWDYRASKLWGYSGAIVIKKICTGCMSIIYGESIENISCPKGETAIREKL